MLKNTCIKHCYLNAIANTAKTWQQHSNNFKKAPSQPTTKKISFYCFDVLESITSMLSKSLHEQTSSVSGLGGNQIQTISNQGGKVSSRAFTEKASPTPPSTTKRESRLSVSAAGVMWLTASLAFQMGS